jgi:two-component system, chemotaxis family, response regulator Rcp1
MSLPEESPYVVLLVDDNPADQFLTRRALKKSNNHIDFHVAQDGEEALAYLRHEGPFADHALSPRPDIILLDLNMPRMNGDQLLQELRADPALRRLVVVVLTSSEYDRDIHASYDKGANAYIVKPVTLDAFEVLMADVKRFWLKNGFVRRPTQDHEGED